MLGTINVVAPSPSPTPSPSPISFASPRLRLPLHPRHRLRHHPRLRRGATPSPTPSASPSPTPIPRVGEGAVRVVLTQVATGLTAPNDLMSVGTDDSSLSSRRERSASSRTMRFRRRRSLISRPVWLRSPPVMTSAVSSASRFIPASVILPAPVFRKFYTYTSEPVSGAADFTVPKTGAFDHQSVIAEWRGLGEQSGCR